MERRTWLVAAVAIVLLALGVRIWEVERTSPYRPANDGQSYLTLASEVAHRGDYVDSHAPRSGAGGKTSHPAQRFRGLPLSADEKGSARDGC